MSRAREAILNVAIMIVAAAAVGGLSGMGIVIYFALRSQQAEGIPGALPFGVLFGTIFGFMLGICVAVASTVALQATRPVAWRTRRLVYAIASAIGSIPAAIFLIAAILLADPLIVSVIVASVTALAAGFIVFPRVVPRLPTQSADATAGVESENH